jgi:hypothetical protein
MVQGHCSRLPQIFPRFIQLTPRGGGPGQSPTMASPSHHLSAVGHRCTRRSRLFGLRFHILCALLLLVRARIPRHFNTDHKLNITWVAALSHGRDTLITFRDRNLRPVFFQFLTRLFLAGDATLYRSPLGARSQVDRCLACRLDVIARNRVGHIDHEAELRSVAGTYMQNLRASLVTGVLALPHPPCRLRAACGYRPQGYPITQWPRTNLTSGPASTIAMLPADGAAVFPRCRPPRRRHDVTNLGHSAYSWYRPSS